MSKKILIAGGSGFIGIHLAKFLLEKNFQVGIITRHAAKVRQQMPSDLAILEWDYQNPEQIKKQVQNYQVVINLSGASVFSFWQFWRRKEIIQSRIQTTKALVQTLSEQQYYVQISGAHIYTPGIKGKRLETDEIKPNTGLNFLQRLSLLWEEAALTAKSKVRKMVILRLGVVVGEGSPFNKALTKILKFRLFPAPSGGFAPIPCIGLEDLLVVFEQVLDQEVEGIVNCVNAKGLDLEQYFLHLAAKAGKKLWVIHFPRILVKLLGVKLSKLILEEIAFDNAKLLKILGRPTKGI